MGLGCALLWQPQTKIEDFAFAECKVPDLGAPLRRLAVPRCFHASFFPPFTSHTNARRQRCRPGLAEASAEANIPLSLTEFL